MLKIYSSNSLRALFEQLSDNLSISQTGVFEAHQLIVESPSMQQWLQMQFAQQSEIAMNFKFSAPWKYINDLLLDIGKQTHGYYHAEVLSWRIDQLLANEFIHPAQELSVITYYCDKEGRQNSVLRHQLAKKVAELYESYILYRPDWLLAWENDQVIDEIAHHPDQPWLKWIWKQLIQQHSQHPIKELESLLQSIETFDKTVSIFAINSLSPQYLDLFSQLAEDCPIDVYHLNPCVQFWFDIKSDRQVAQQALNSSNQEEQSINPLLANSAKQGKDFTEQLFECSNYDVNEVFIDEFTPGSLLQQIQADIIQLQAPTSKPELCGDDSIEIHSTHGNLREVQVLHDYLLRQFTENKNLRFRDVLVICTDIEQYTPYIQATFNTNRFSDDKTNVLPAAIIDAKSPQEHQMQDAFLNILAISQGNFEVTQLIALLDVSSVHEAFEINSDELPLIRQWLKETKIHYGFSSTLANGMFSWEWGLKRLLLGFSMGDEPVIQENILTQPIVEGQSAIILGKLIQFIEMLQYHCQQLQKAALPKEWKKRLYKLLDCFFCTNDEQSQYAYQTIENHIDTLFEHLHDADYQDKLDIRIVQQACQEIFSKQVSTAQYFSGKVNFSSLVGMRNIPYKRIAFLGLNEVNFPRQFIPLSFDLMGTTKPRKGDRALRDDDRYLFLQALMAAQEKMYLSYQGNSIRDNSEKQQSIVLRELIAVMKNYGWSDKNIIAHPLHPFSLANYQAVNPSFDQQWFRLATVVDPIKDNLNISIPPFKMSETIDIEQLVRFADNPLKVFAQQRLKLYFESHDEDLSDVEPYQFDTLDKYQFNQQCLQAILEQSNVEEMINVYRLNGLIIDAPPTEKMLKDLQAKAQKFADEVCSQGKLKRYTSNINFGDISLSADLDCLENNEFDFIDYRFAKCTAKDKFRFWLHHLSRVLETNKKIKSMAYFWNDKKTTKVESYCLADIDAAHAKEYLEQLLTYYQIGMNKPLFALLNYYCSKKEVFEKHWPEKGEPFSDHIHHNFATALDDETDAYCRWFLQNVDTHKMDWTEELGWMKTIFEPMLVKLESKK